MGECALLHDYVFICTINFLIIPNVLEHTVTGRKTSIINLIIMIAIAVRGRPADNVFRVAS